MSDSESEKLRSRETERDCARAIESARESTREKRDKAKHRNSAPNASTNTNNECLRRNACVFTNSVHVALHIVTSGGIFTEQVTNSDHTRSVSISSYPRCFCGSDTKLIEPGISRF